MQHIKYDKFGEIQLIMMILKKLDIYKISNVIEKNKLFKSVIQKFNSVSQKYIMTDCKEESFA